MGFDLRATRGTSPGRTAATVAGTDRYVGLDALRGVAAVAVLCYHFSERIDLPGLCPHGYLAVDFFFILSGFVMARAYASRIATGSLTIGRFYRMRAIRLLPLVVLGTLLAATIEWHRPGVADQVRHTADTVVALVLGSVLIPILWQTTLEHVVFPLNGPVWSLFFEAASNLVFAPLARARAGRRVIPALLALSVLGLVWGVCSSGGASHLGAVDASFWFGFARIGWSFTMGVVLFVWHERALRLPFVLPTVGLVAVLVMPDLGAANETFDLITVLVVLPLLVFAASSARFGVVGRRLSAWSGDLSYPVYALHYPLVRALCFVGSSWHLSQGGRVGFVAAGLLAILTVSAVANALYDVPIRRLLSRRRLGTALLTTPAWASISGTLRRNRADRPSLRS